MTNINLFLVINWILKGSKAIPETRTALKLLNGENKAKKWVMMLSVFSLFNFIINNSKWILLKFFFIFENFHP